MTTSRSNKIVTTCAVAGCTRNTATVYSFCTDHMHRAYPCAVKDCGFMVAAYNKSGYCYDHRWVAQKVKRMARAEEAEKMRATIKEAAKPIVTRKKKVAP